MDGIYIVLLNSCPISMPVCLPPSMLYYRLFFPKFPVCVVGFGLNRSQFIVVGGSCVIDFLGEAFLGASRTGRTNVSGMGTQINLFFHYEVDLRLIVDILLPLQLLPHLVLDVV